MREITILGISGSPRKGNTEWLLNKFLEAAAARGADTRLILLRRQSIRLCRGCLACEAGGAGRQGICRTRDDMQELYPALLDASGIVFGTPVYFSMLSGLLKNFMDRTCPIWPSLEGKPVAGIAVAEEGIGSAIRNLRTYADLCKMPWVGSLTALAKGPADVSKHAGIPPRLRRLAEKLVTAAGQQHASCGQGG